MPVRADRHPNILGDTTARDLSFNLNDLDEFGLLHFKVTVLIRPE